MHILDVNLVDNFIGNVIMEMACDPVWEKAEGNNLEDHVLVARRLAKRLANENLIAGDLATFIRRSGAPWGLAILRNLPIHDDPKRSLFLLAELLGTVVRYAYEGDYLIEVKEDPSSAVKRPGFNNSKEFFPHTDLSYIDSPPIFFCLHSIVNDIRQGGLSEFVDIDDVVKCLPRLTVDALRQNDFLFPAPKHYNAGGSVQRPILQPGREGTDRIRFRRDNLRSLSRRGIDAVVELCRTIQEIITEVFLEPDAVAVIDNCRVLHGRTAFLGGAAAEHPRHINRLYFEPRVTIGASDDRVHRSFLPNS